MLPGQRHAPSHHHAAQQLVQDDAKRKHVDLFIVLPPSQHLWSHIHKAAYFLCGINELLAVFCGCQPCLKLLHKLRAQLRLLRLLPLLRRARRWVGGSGIRRARAGRSGQGRGRACTAAKVRDTSWLCCIMPAALGPCRAAAHQQQQQQQQNTVRHVLV